MREGAVSFGLALFQLGVREIDSRPASKPGDLVTALAWLAGRIAQRSAMRDEPDRFIVDQSSNGTLFLRNDKVTRKLGRVEPGSLASALVEAALMAGSKRFPDFQTVRHDAIEAIQRRGEGDYRGISLSAEPCVLAALLQDDVHTLLFERDDSVLLLDAAIAACGHAVGFNRNHLDPAIAAELSLSVAFHAGWADQRKTKR
ncbi:MAG: hypothetical protein WCC66_14865 [Rhizobiaceae bacterium]